MMGNYFQALNKSSAYYVFILEQSSIEIKQKSSFKGKDFYHKPRQPK